MRYRIERRGSGRASRAPLLAAAFAVALASHPSSASEGEAGAISDSSRIEIPLPRAGILYVRYGSPGGVRILRGGRPEQELQGTAGDSIRSAIAPPVSADSSARDRLLDALRLYALEAGSLLGPEGSPSVDDPRRLSPTPGPETALAERGVAVPRLPSTEPGRSEPGDRGVVPVPVPLVVERDPERREPPLEGTTEDRVTGELPAPPGLAPEDSSEGAGLAAGAGSLGTDPAEPSVEAESPAELRAQLAAGRLVHTQAILFETNRTALLPGAQPILDELARFLREQPEVRISIEGHADSRGPAEANQALSEARARAVRDALLARGATPGQLTVIGYGESRPLDPRSTLEAYAFNRRVAFRLLAPGSAPTRP